MNIIIHLFNCPYLFHSISNNNIREVKKMKKAFCITLALALFLGLATCAQAGNNTLGFGKDKPELKITAEQKEKLISLKIQMLELKKQIVKKNVEDGTITPEQGKLMEEKINTHIEAVKSGKWDRKFHQNHPPRQKKPQ